MKKMFTIASLLISGICYSQPTCYIYEADNTNKSIGDSAYVGVMAIDGVPNAFTSICRIYIKDSQNNLTEVFHASYWDVMNSPKYWSGSDSLIKCKFTIPSGCSNGPAKYVAHDNTFDFNINTITTNIEEYQRMKQRMIIDYNLLGQKIK